MPLAYTSRELFSGTVYLEADESTTLCALERQNNFRDTVEFWNGSTGAVTFTMNYTYVAVGPEQGAQLKLYAFGTHYVTARANWSAGYYPLTVTQYWD